MLIGFLFLVLLLAIAVLTIAVLVTILVSGIVSNVHGAPFVPIKRQYLRPLLLWAGLSANDIFYDLGCGDARVLISAVKDFGVKKAIGYEVALWPYLNARFNVMSDGFSDKIKILRKDFFFAKGRSASGGKADLSSAGFVYMYLFPKLVDRLAPKLACELASGSKILCPSFPINLACHPEFKLLKSEKIGKITAYLYQKV